MKTPYDIIRKPILTEKGYDNLQNKVYTFQVATDATKTEVKQAVEAAFGVKVESVRTINVLGKIKRQGATQGRRPSTKKAYVKLTEDSKGIEFFDSLAQ